MSDEHDKTIRFIDSGYNTLFTVPDGGGIVLTYSDGEKLTLPCKFIDECHTRIGNYDYHICEFAERMERNGTSYAPEKPPELPDKCYSVSPSGEIISIEKGKKGYEKCPFSVSSRLENRKRADSLNARLGVYGQQEAAMMGGATKGWTSPEAKISNYDVRGNYIAPVKTRKPPRRVGVER